MEPVTELDARFSAEDATAIEWTQARQQLEAAQVYWLTTVRADGRPHVTPLLAVWLDGALYFSTGPTEQKYRNLESNPHCAVTTGCNAMDTGLDLVVEGTAVRVTDEARLRAVADAIAAKYTEEWRFQVRDGAFHHGPGEAHVFAVAPVKVLGFGKGRFSQTRWRFSRN